MKGPAGGRSVAAPPLSADSPLPRFPCQGRICVDEANLCEKDKRDDSMTAIVRLKVNVPVTVLEHFKDSESDSEYFQVSCHLPKGPCAAEQQQQGWVRRESVELAVEADQPVVVSFSSPQSFSLPPEPAAKSGRPAWICRNGGKKVGGDTSVRIYSSMEASKQVVDTLQNDAAVQILEEQSDWFQIKFVLQSSEERTGWVQKAHLRFNHLITEQPRLESQAFAAGCRLYLSVKTDKPDLHYQWQHRKQNAQPGESFTDIASQNSNGRVFSIDSATPDHSGSYRVVVSDTKDQECSEIVTFVIINPPANAPPHVVPSVPSTFNVLLMGETGTGKSTFVNLLANHFASSTMQKIADSDKWDIKVAIKTPHLNVSGNEYSSSQGSEAGGAASNAQTQTCCSYSMTKTVVGRGRCTFNFIDSPGLNDPRGKEQDDKVWAAFAPYSTISRHSSARTLIFCLLLSEFEQHFANASRFAESWPQRTRIFAERHQPEVHHQHPKHAGQTQGLHA